MYMCAPGLKNGATFSFVVLIFHMLSFPSLTHAHSQIDQIQRLNNLWSSETIHSRTTLKIPIDSAPRPPSPSSNMTERRSSTSAVSRLQNGSSGSSIVDSTDSCSIADEEVVRSKPRGHRSGQRSASVSVAYGEKNISDILSAADRQLRLSKQFAEKLASKKYIPVCN